MKLVYRRASVADGEGSALLSWIVLPTWQSNVAKANMAANQTLIEASLSFFTNRTPATTTKNAVKVALIANKKLIY
jgi:hypothetical protein